MEPETKLALDVAGWSESRSVEVDDTVESLISSGYVVPPAVVEALSSFQGIRVLAKVDGRFDFFWIDAERACDRVFPEWISYYSEQVGVALVPIGYAYMDHMVVMMDSNERVFAGFDEELIEMGGSIFEAIQYFLVPGSLASND